MDCCHVEQGSEEKESLLPLAVIVTYILGGVFLRASISGDFSPHTLMTNFMGGFFVVFSLFKFFDLQGFATAYGKYDLVAQRVSVWGLIYPFIELALGICYLMDVWPIAVNLATALIMGVGAVGVFGAIKRKEQIDCACLGSTLKLPMTEVTLVEDLLMGVMAVLMLYV